MAYQIFVNDAWVAPEKAHVSVKDIGFLRGYGIFDFFT
jgi:branched-subunit amino acid aminotransferase/4-amino-4-deoxychorismate lyase